MAAMRPSRDLWHGWKDILASEENRTEGVGRKEKDYEQHNTEDASTYEYDDAKLEPGQGKIRLLEVLPGSEEDSILCKLSTVTLSSSPAYEAMSYAWGKSDEKLKIQINDKVGDVSTTVRAALRHLRRQKESVFLWIDSICINQTDEDEKSDQVKLMRDIYSGCKQTVVWLGAAWEGSSVALRCMRVFGIASRLYKPDMTMEELTRLVTEECDENFAWVQVHLTNKNASYDVWDIFIAAWTWRSWCVQEIVLAPKAELVIGWSSLDWSIFCDGFDFGIVHDLFNTQVGAIDLTYGYQNIAAAVLHSKGKSDITRWSLLDVLHEFRAREASLPQDKVFAMLGLVSEEQRLGLLPDYGIPTVDVYRQVTTVILKNSSDLDVLGTANATPSSSIRDNDTGREWPLQSWIADWRTHIPIKSRTWPQVERTPSGLARLREMWRHKSDPADSAASGDAVSMQTPDITLDEHQVNVQEMVRFTSATPFRRFGNGMLRNNLATLGSRSIVGFDDEGTTLTLNGFVCDALTEVSDVIPSYLETTRGDKILHGFNVENLQAQVDDLDKIAGARDTLKEVWHLGGTLVDLIVGSLSFIMCRPSEVYLNWEKLAGVNKDHGKEAKEYWQTITAGNRLSTGPGADGETEEEFKKWYWTLRDFRRWLKWRIVQPDPEKIHPLAIFAFMRGSWKRASMFATLLSHTEKRALARTKSGHLALVPGGAKIGDKLALCKGGKIPLAIRERNDGKWTFVGETYVHHVMDGKTFKEELCQPMRFI